MSLIQELWVFSTLMSNLAVVLMMIQYKRMQRSLDSIALNVNKIARDKQEQ